VYKQELAGKIREAGYAAVLEITNGLNSERFASKCNEANWGKSYLHRCLKAEQQEQPEADSKIQIDSGVIFFKNESAISKSKYSLNFLYQLKELKRARSLQALEEVIKSDQTPPGVSALAECFFKLINYHSFPMERLFYPTDREIIDINRIMNANKILPEMPSVQEKYQEAVRHVKGRVLESYISLLCSQLMRSPQPTIIQKQEYEHNGHVVDIDLIIIGDKDTIRKTLLNSHDLKRFETTKKDKEHTIRYSHQLAMHRR
jgi:hypothetical protein